MRAARRSDESRSAERQPYFQASFATQTRRAGLILSAQRCRQWQAWRARAAIAAGAFK
jgi:hypothetical protein